jgi:hypothetical protein
MSPPPWAVVKRPRANRLNRGEAEKAQLSSFAIFFIFSYRGMNAHILLFADLTDCKINENGS